MKYSEQYYKEKIEFRCKLKRSCKSALSWIGTALLIVAVVVVAASLFILACELVTVALNWGAEIKRLEDKCGKLERSLAEHSAECANVHPAKNPWQHVEPIPWRNMMTNVIRPEQFTTNHYHTITNQVLPGLMLTNFHIHPRISKEND